MPGHLSVLVTGATGNQGGAIARLLLSRGHRVRALTRKPSSPAVGKLKALGAEIAVGHMEDHDSMSRAMKGMNAVFSVSTPFESGPEAEKSQGITVANTAKHAGVRHLVYASVPRANTNTNIPHFESKALIERHIDSLNVPWTVLGPTFFMENLSGPYFRPELLEGHFSIPLPAGCKLQLICLEDVAAFGTRVFEQREHFLGKRIDIAGDELTPPVIADTLAHVIGRQISYRRKPIEHVRAWSKDLALVYEWFEREGTQIDIFALKRDYPDIGWHSLRQWAEAQAWNVLTHGAVQ
jgi:uncharacterized protein YbjT (DUF2867 family)